MWHEPCQAQGIFAIHGPFVELPRLFLLFHTCSCRDRVSYTEMILDFRPWRPGLISGTCTCMSVTMGCNSKNHLAKKHHDAESSLRNPCFKKSWVFLSKFGQRFPSRISSHFDCCTWAGATQPFFQQLPSPPCRGKTNRLLFRRHWLRRHGRNGRTCPLPLPRMSRYQKKVPLKGAKFQKERIATFQSHLEFFTERCLFVFGGETLKQFSEFDVMNQQPPMDGSSGESCYEYTQLKDYEIKI